DGRPVSSCLLLASQATDAEIVTIEGIAENGDLHPVQEAYIACTGYQCSFCTPGFILSTVALLTENPGASEDEIREYLAGNLCRCGSYIKIMDSVKLAQARWTGKEAA
ncbi:MAG TPA: 2Fe-2S iron-sulfur cluster-binding protein, partial [Candidatus Binatia bacterium]|nr:2Fe-2S iron-sulfur cluster-binding protein [Candidatus Binatia bacterium]